MKAFVKTADNVIETTLAGTISQKVESFTTIIYTVGRETFGTEGVKVKHKVYHQQTDARSKSAM